MPTMRAPFFVIISYVVGNGYCVINPSVLPVKNDLPCWCSTQLSSGSDIYQLVAATGNNTMELVNTKVLLDMMKNEARVGWRKVAIIGVVGKYRAGKSTLLNIVHRYLKCLAKAPASQEMRMEDWLYEREDLAQCPKTFGTASSAKGFTKGIWITREPVILRETTGQEVAVFLIDTQGMMDNINNQEAESPLFYLTSMLSSTLVVNTMNVLDRQLTDLVGSLTLQVSTSVGQELQAQGKVLQQIVFLVRDWNLEYDYGWDGGETYLQEYFETDIGRSASVAQELRSGFDNVSCFLMPNIAASTKNLKILPTRLTEEFGPQCRIFLDRLFKSATLTAKTVFGQQITGHQFAKHVELFAQMFKNGSLQSVGDVYSNQLGLMAQEVVDTGVRRYYTNMTTFLSSLEEISDPALLSLHSAIKNQSEAWLTSASVLKQRPTFQKHALSVFSKKVETAFSSISAAETNKRRLFMARLREAGDMAVQDALQFYRTEMAQFMQQGFYGLEELLETHHSTKNLALQTFVDKNPNVTRNAEIHNETVSKFEKEVTVPLQDFSRQTINEQEALDDAKEEALLEYHGVMESNTLGDAMPDFQIKQLSDTAAASVLSALRNATVMQRKPFAASIIARDMIPVLTAAFQSYQSQNANKTEQLVANIPDFTSKLSALGDILQNSAFSALGMVGDGVMAKVNGVISAVTKIIQLVMILSQRTDRKYERLILEFVNLNERLGVAERRITNSIALNFVKDEYRDHLQAITNIKTKANAMVQNANNGTRAEFLRVCEQNDPDNILQWLSDRISGRHGHVLGEFLQDVVRGTEYNRTEFGLWAQSILALETQAVMYRLMYMQLSGRFDNATITSQTFTMKEQIKSIFENLKLKHSEIMGAFPVLQLESDVKQFLMGIQESTAQAAAKLKAYLESKYDWLNWAVILYAQSCNGDDFYRVLLRRETPDRASGFTSGFVHVPNAFRWSAFVAWKTDDEIRITDPVDRQMVNARREISYYSQQDRWEPTVVRGIRNVGKFTEQFLKPLLNSVGLNWSAVAIVKADCDFVMEPKSTAGHGSKFFVHHFDGYECTFTKMPFVCGWIVLSGQAHIVVFPAADVSRRTQSAFPSLLAAPGVV